MKNIFSLTLCACGVLIVLGTQNTLSASDGFEMKQDSLQEYLTHIQKLKNEIIKLEDCNKEKDYLHKDIKNIEDTIKAFITDIHHYQLDRSHFSKFNIFFDDQRNMYLYDQKYVEKIKDFDNIISSIKKINNTNALQIWRQYKSKEPLSPEASQEFLEITGIKLEEIMPNTVEHTRNKLQELSQSNQFHFTTIEKSILNKIGLNLIQNLTDKKNSLQCDKSTIENLRSSLGNYVSKATESHKGYKDVINFRKNIDSIWENKENYTIDEVIKQIRELSDNKIEISSLPKPTLVCHEYAAYDSAGLTEEIYAKLESKDQIKFGSVSSGLLYVKKFLDFFEETQSPMEGDLVIYLDLTKPTAIREFYQNGSRPHSAIYINENQVKSSWASYGGKLFTHPIFMVPSEFGTGVLYYTLKPEYKGPGKLLNEFCKIK